MMMTMMTNSVSHTSWPLSTVPGGGDGGTSPTTGRCAVWMLVAMMAYPSNPFHPVKGLAVLVFQNVRGQNLERYASQTKMNVEYPLTWRIAEVTIILKSTVSI